jgi:hypothetical protein
MTKQRYNALTDLNVARYHLVYSHNTFRIIHNAIKEHINQITLF